MRTWCPSPLDDGALLENLNKVTSQIKLLYFTNKLLYNPLVVKIKKINPNYILVPVVIAITLFVYIHFSSYSPQSTTENLDVTQAQPTEVKGIAKNKTRIPYPINSEKLSESESEGNKSIILQTTETPEKMKNFYDNALIAKEWMIETETKEDNFYAVIYTKDDETIDMFIAKQQEDQDDENAITIVTIELSKN